MNTTKLISGVIFSVFISISVYADENQSSEKSRNETGNVITTVMVQHSQDEHHISKAPPLKPYPRLLPLKLIAPSTAQVGIPLTEVNVRLLNPGLPAPNARLRLIIHNKDPRHVGDLHALSSDNVKVEVLEDGTWKTVLLGMVEDGVMGAIGSEGVSEHRERHKRGGFEIPSGLNKTWQLRVTFKVPGIYSLVAAVSPDNGSRHLVRPAHSIIEVQ